MIKKEVNRSKKNRKFGRNKDSPSMKRYNAERRDLVHKAARIKKDKKIKEKAKLKREALKTHRGMQLAKQLGV